MIDSKKKDYTKSNLNPHKEARFAMWYYGSLYADSGLGSMEFYEQYLLDANREMCERAVKDILSARDKKEGEK